MEVFTFKVDSRRWELRYSDYEGEHVYMFTTYYDYKRAKLLLEKKGYNQVNTRRW